MTNFAGNSSRPWIRVEILVHVPTRVLVSGVYSKLVIVEVDVCVEPGTVTLLVTVGCGAQQSSTRGTAVATGAGFTVERNEVELTDDAVDTRGAHCSWSRAAPLTQVASTVGEAVDVDQIVYRYQDVVLYKAPLRHSVHQSMIRGND